MVSLFRKQVRDEAGGSPPNDAMEGGARAAGTALYVDTENLQGNTQGLVTALMEQWPEGIPPASRLNLYVQADQTALWDIWASSQFRELVVTVRGIQHFSKRQSKNSADIAIAIDAVADFVTGAAQFVAVMSDDSDFMPLYAKLKDLTEERAPFLWVVTDRPRTRSSTIEDYFPNDHIYVARVAKGGARVSVERSTRSRARALPAGEASSDSPATGRGSAGRAARKADDPPVAGKRGEGDLAEMADLIIRNLQVGHFKSTDCQPIIRSRWPNDPMVGMPSARFGTEFAQALWPILEGRGVKLSSTQPRKYELTAEVKNARALGKGAGSNENRPPQE